MLGRVVVGRVVVGRGVLGWVVVGRVELCSVARSLVVVVSSACAGKIVTKLAALLQGR